MSANQLSDHNHEDARARFGPMVEYITALINAMDHLTENEVTELTAEAAARDAALALLEKAWDEGFADGVNHDLGDWENAPSAINNPYRQETDA